MKKVKKIALVLFVILTIISLAGIVAAHKRRGHPSRSPSRHHHRRHYPHPGCFIASVAGNSSQVAILTEFRELLFGR